MPASASAVGSTWSWGRSRDSARPNAPPTVAPMNIDGENTPPDAPEPRVSEVAAQLEDEQEEQEPDAGQRPV